LTFARTPIIVQRIATFVLFSRLFEDAMRTFLLVLFVIAFTTPNAMARPAHLKALTEYLGSFAVKSLNDCRVCHLADTPAEGEKPHNRFGERLVAVKETSKKSDIVVRLELIADEDADGDGVSNLAEMLVGRQPGDAKDVPTAEQKTESIQHIAQFRKERALIAAWTPFEPVKRPTIQSIDAFIDIEHKARGLTPRPEAPKSVLLRRIYVDLIGLPPTRDELQAFLNDTSPNAYEQVVDRLLQSPRYGERWGRHWMDVWRYADWAGYGAEVRDSQPHIWRWRDWIVESLNEDKGYDQMVREMLAADEIAPTDEKALRATGFLVRNWFKFNRQIWLDRDVEHVGKAFLGITLNCARCHDHFYDPIAQTEYYAFRAFFEPHDIRVDRMPGEVDVTKLGTVRVFDANPMALTHLFVRGEDHNPDKSKAITPAIPSAIHGSPLKIETVQLPKLAYQPDDREFVLNETRDANQRAIESAQQKHETAKKALTSQLIPPLDPLTSIVWRTKIERLKLEVQVAEATLQLARVKSEILEAHLGLETIDPTSDTWKASATALVELQRSAPHLEATIAVRNAEIAQWVKSSPQSQMALDKSKMQLAMAETALKQPLTTKFTPRVVKTYPATSTGRRLALANWIADRQNPLTARVAVNHIWLRHFGQALVPSVFDFGKNGRRPTHPQLLDFLSDELMSHNWSMKHLHKLIVTSKTYRMDSTAVANGLKLDPDNQYYWRLKPRRMEAEAVRDSVLFVAGELDPMMGGVELDHNAGLTSKRRSLYFRHAPEKQVEFLTLFDSANMAECYQRSESIVPQQALALANSSLVQSQSRTLAKKLTLTVGVSTDANASFVRTAFEIVLSRPATSMELETCLQFLTDQTRLLSDRTKLNAIGVGANIVPPAAEPHLRARENLIHVLINHNDFVTIR